jgi:hypothetical protein
MADRLTFFLNKHLLTPYTQFGARKGSSTTDAALTFTHNIQAARNKGLVTTALTFDIEGYFDFVNHNNLLTKMRETRLPLPMVNWMATLFANQLAAICIDGHCTEIQRVLNGLPQGSPIPGPASSLYTSNILQHMQEITFKERQIGCSLENITPSTMVMYTDDSNIWVSSFSLLTNTHILQAAYYAM